MKLVMIGLLALSLNSFATDKVGMSYIDKEELSGISIKVDMFKLEHLNGERKAGSNVVDDRREINLLVEPDFTIVKFQYLQLQVSPSVGVSRKNSLVTESSPNSENAGHVNFTEKSSTKLLTGASLGLVLEPKEGLHISSRVGKVGNGDKYKNQVSFGVSFDY